MQRLIAADLGCSIHSAVKIGALILLNNKPNTLFGNAMFEFFVKHAVCNRSVWVFANKRRVNTVSSNSVFDLNIAVSRPSVLTFCRADLLCLCWDGLQR